MTIWDNDDLGKHLGYSRMPYSFTSIHYFLKAKDADMSKGNEFGLSIGAGRHSETNQPVVTLEIDGFGMTQMSPERALDLAANFTKAAYVAEQHAVLYAFFTQLGQLPEEEIGSMLTAVGAYMQSTPEEREEMREEIAAVRQAVEVEGEKPTREEILAAREAYLRKGRGHG